MFAWADFYYFCSNAFWRNKRFLSSLSLSNLFLILLLCTLYIVAHHSESHSENQVEMN